MNRKNLYFASAISLLFFILGCFFAWNHEIWLDESYHYLLPRSSVSVSQMVRNSAPYGHPILWNIVLFYYGKIAPGIFEMQVLHCLIASLCIFIISYYSPFNTYEKLLIVYGYFFMYEYNVIAKNYTLGFMLVFLALILFEKNKKLWVIAITLGLAANVHLFTLFLSASVFIYIGIKRFEAPFQKQFLPIVIFLLLLIVAAIQIIPPENVIREYDSFNHSSLLSVERLKRAFGSFGKGLVNIPDFRTVHYWNSNFIYNISHLLNYLLSALLVVLVFFHLHKNRKLLLLFFIPVSFIMCFVYLAPLSIGIRYWGYYYVLLIICTWLLRRQTESTSFSKVFFVSILSIQFLVSLPALLVDYYYPFSNAKKAATILKEQKKERYPLFTEKLALGPPLSAYMGKPVFYPSSKTFETFSFRFVSKKYTAHEFVQESLVKLKEMHFDTCILVLATEMPDSVPSFFKHTCFIDKIAVLENAIVPSENYFLYLLSKKDG